MNEVPEVIDLAVNIVMAKWIFFLKFFPYEYITNEKGILKTNSLEICYSYDHWEGAITTQTDTAFWDEYEDW